MYTILYHPQVRDDIAAIGGKEQSQIRQAIEKKLQHQPVIYGKPLQHSLRGLRSLRVGDYRVVFQLNSTEVYIVLIAHRSVVYKKAQKRDV